MKNKKTRIVTLIMVLVLAFAMLAGCGSTANAPASAPVSDTHIVTDMSGNEVEVPTVVDKYADAWYAHNEVICMLDKAKGLVATIQTPQRFPWLYVVQPNMYQALSTFGDEFNLEELVALEPDVVFHSNEELREQLAAVGIPLVNVMFRNYDEMKKSIAITGEVLGGEAPTIAADYCAYLDRVLTSLDEKVSTIKDEDKPTVLHGNGMGALNVDGGNTIIDAWITAAGGINVAAAEVEGTQGVTLEQVLTWDPDIIITGSAEDAETIKASPEWATLKAVQSGNVYANPKGGFQWDRYGVEGALQLQWAANLFHPDMFDYDINTIVKDFYTQFLDYELSDDQLQLILDAKNPE